MGARLARFFGFEERLKAPSLRLFKSPHHFSIPELGTLAITAGIHNAFLVAGQIASDKINSLPSLVLTSYFYSYLSNLKEILRFKSQGKSLAFDLSSAPGNQIRVETNPYYMLAANLMEEAVVNSALTPVIEGGFPVGNIFRRTVLFGFVKTPVERACANLESRRRVAEREGNLKEARRLEIQRLLLSNFFFNLVIPALRTAELFSPEGPLRRTCEAVTAGVLSSVGCVAVVEEILRQRKLASAQRRLAKPGSCSSLLIHIEGQSEIENDSFAPVSEEGTAARPASSVSAITLR